MYLQIHVSFYGRFTNFLCAVNNDNQLITHLSPPVLRSVLYIILKEYHKMYYLKIIHEMN